MLARLTFALIILAFGGWLETEQLAGDEPLIGKLAPITIVNSGRSMPLDAIAASAGGLPSYSPADQIPSGRRSDPSTPVISAVASPDHRVRILSLAPVDTSLSDDEVKLQQSIRADIERMKAVGIGTP